ncbi:MAG: glycerol-3-phosphate dehydrogenase, partial [Kiritimatiellaeota bacterium]|nr:glycerol-3-phosphate dehydrogenase [Kiritimatiellota bacterium]
GPLGSPAPARHSRNRRFGERLATGETAEHIANSTAQVAEGAWNCHIALALAAETGVELPIAAQVQRVLDGATHPRDVVTLLMGRDVKPE